MRAHARLGEVGAKRRMAMHAHLVFVTKFRRRLLTDITDRTKTCTRRSSCCDVRHVWAKEAVWHGEHTMGAMCVELDVELVEFNGEADHVTCIYSWPTPPTWAISVLVQRLKGRTAYAVRREFTGACVRARMRGHLWSPCPIPRFRRR